MSIKPVLIAPGPDLTKMMGSTCGYWSPTALGMDTIALPAGEFRQTPPLFCPGLNAFMLLVTIPDFILGNVLIVMVNPEDDVSLGVSARHSPGGSIGGGQQILTAGAFSLATDFVDGAGPVVSEVPSSRALIWWNFVIVFNNDDVIDTTVNLRVWGGRR